MAKVPLPDGTDPPAIGALEVAALAHRCHEETTQFLAQRPSHDAFCMELFRRALVEREEDAWRAVYATYTILVRRWITTLGLATQAGVEADDLVNAAFERLWHAISGTKFARFQSLSALIQYLKMCTRCAALDCLRAQSARAAEVLASECDDAYRAVAAEVDVETTALVSSSQSDLWATVQTVLQNPQDALVVRLSFVDGLTPRQIHALHATVFASVGDVYRVKRNALERLSRHPALRAYAGELLSHDPNTLHPPVDAGERVDHRRTGSIG
jgi:RNA polymerase sigma factor (sigma-70 family)